jgi:hypothetical protein
MRRLSLPLMIFVALIAPKSSDAQVAHRPTPPPLTTAATADWQLTGEPVFFAGDFYYPSGATVYFDGNVMRRSGVYLGVPLYEDVTIQPHGIVYLPIGRSLMRPYQRHRDGELAELAAASGRTGSARSIVDVDDGSFIGDACEADRDDVPAGGQSRRRNRYRHAMAAPASLSPTTIQSVPAPLSNDGVWIDFEGARWYLDGRAVSYDAARFTPVGNYRGFPVYRESVAANARIFVTVVADGPVAPFARRP